MSKKKYEIVLNKLLIRKYPFIEDVEVYRLTPLFFGVGIDINFCVKRDFIKTNVTKTCIDEIPDSEPILLSLLSFNLCSKIKLPTNELIDILENTYKLTMDYEKISHFSTNLTVVAPNINGEY